MHEKSALEQLSIIENFGKFVQLQKTDLMSSCKYSIQTYSLQQGAIHCPPLMKLFDHTDVIYDCQQVCILNFSEIKACNFPFCR